MLSQSKLVCEKNFKILIFGAILTTPMSTHVICLKAPKKFIYSLLIEQVDQTNSWFKSVDKKVVGQRIVSCSKHLPKNLTSQFRSLYFFIVFFSWFFFYLDASYCCKMDVFPIHILVR